MNKLKKVLSWKLLIYRQMAGPENIEGLHYAFAVCEMPPYSLRGRKEREDDVSLVT